MSVAELNAVEEKLVAELVKNAVMLDRGHFGLSNIIWEVKSDDFIDLKVLGEVQMKLGYHPNGYGGPFIDDLWLDKDDKVVTQWHCWGNCD